MSSKYDQFQITLKSSGNSMTTARQVIFEALSENHPISMAALVKLCSGSCDRASIYRTIALFERLDIVTKVNIGWKYKLELSDKFSNHHHHLTCTICGKMVPINESQEIENLILKLASDAGFTSGKHQLEINGTCQSCQRNGRANQQTASPVR